MKNHRMLTLCLSASLALLIAAGCTPQSRGASKSGKTLVADIEPLGKSSMKGMLTAKEGRNGTVTIDMRVEGLSAGMHGTHIHSGASCADDGKAAGPHWDPHNTAKHGRPAESATQHHAADMPSIEVNKDGRGTMRFQTANFKLDDLAGKTVVVHANPDNYTDSPANGGSGPRVGCGVIRRAK